LKLTSWEDEELLSGNVSKCGDVSLEVLGKNCIVHFLVKSDGKEEYYPPSAGTWSSQSVNYNIMSDQTRYNKI